MTWFFLALATALCEAFKDVTIKKGVGDVPGPVVAWGWVFWALPVLGAVLLFTEPVTLGQWFWVALLVSSCLNFAAVKLYVSAINSSDLSLTVPMIAFTPLFLLVTSPLILGEFPGFWGVLGVLLVVAGSYLLNIQQRHLGYLAPYRALLSTPGPRRMLLVAFIWSIAANVDKIGLQHSSPVFWVTSVNLVLAVLMTPGLLQRRAHLGHVRQRLPALMLVGCFVAVAVIFQMYAVTMTLVPYVISVKRTSTVMSVFLGHLLLKEPGFTERLSGVVVMLLGVLCITLL